jgi:hypothetical protein
VPVTANRTVDSSCSVSSTAACTCSASLATVMTTAKRLPPSGHAAAGLTMIISMNAAVRVVSILSPAEILIAARRLAGARPHLAAVAGIVDREDLWQLCRDEHRSRRPHQWLGYPRPLVRRRRGHARLGELRRGETIPWRVIAAQIAPRERRGSR